MAAVVVFKGQGFGLALIQPLRSRALGRNGVSSLAVKVLTWNVRDVGWNPTWIHFFQVSGCFKKIISLQNRLFFPYSLFGSHICSLKIHKVVFDQEELLEITRKSLHLVFGHADHNGGG